jgi:hypothetical protein
VKPFPAFDVRRAVSRAVARLEYLAGLGLVTPGSALVLTALRHNDLVEAKKAERSAKNDARRLSEWVRDLPLFGAAAAADCWADEERSRHEAMIAVRFWAEARGMSIEAQERAVQSLLLAELAAPDTEQSP